MPDWGIALSPPIVNVSVVAAQVPVLLHALQIASNYRRHEQEVLQGMGQWLDTFNAALTDEQRNELRVIHWFISDRMIFDNEALTFPEFLKKLEARDAASFVTQSTGWMHKYPYFPGLEAILADYTTYDDFVRRVYAEKGERYWQYDPHQHQQVWEQLSDAEGMKERVVRFLTFAWENHLKQEWKRTEKMLKESADAFSQQDFSGMSAGDIVEAVTNRDLRGRDYFEAEINNATHFIFIPSPYLGPYVSWLHDETNGSDVVFYGARLPRNAPRHSAELNRSELLVRLNALADETRLRMLEMLAREDEICAQDFISGLDLSQSSASRHLRQLTASGYLTERRRDVAKCYSLNRDRIADTIAVLQQLVD